MTGDDDGPGTRARPWRSLNKALHALVAGETAFVDPGTYDLSAGPLEARDERSPVAVHPVNAGTGATPIRLVARSSAASIIGRGNAAEAQDDAHQAFIVRGSIALDQPFWTLEGFYTRDGGGVRVTATHHVTFKNNLVFVDPAPLNGRSFHGGIGLRVTGSHDIVVEGNEIWSINFDAYRQLQPGTDPRETQADLVGIADSQRVTLRKNLLYGGRNNLTDVATEGSVFERNQSFFAQEHKGGPINASNWVYRYNVFYPGGQEGIYAKATCVTLGGAHTTEEKYVNANGEIHNNLAVHSGGVSVRSNDQSPHPCPPHLMGFANLKVRNNLVVTARNQDSCFASESTVVGVVRSDHNLCVHQRASGSAESYWHLYDDPATRWGLTSWRTQSSYPQLLQDPHSRTETAGAVRLGLATAVADLGQLENDRADCEVSLGPAYAGVSTNCEPPHRMRIVDDLRLVDPTSELINAGDPAFGAHVGPFEFDGGT